MVDTSRATVGDLLDVAVRLETASEEFYRGLTQMFAHCPEVAEFWLRFAGDEVLHRKRLVELRASMSDEKLSENIDRNMLEAGRKLLRISSEELLRRVHNLDDAYEMAHDLESSETNTIFRFFMAQFVQDKWVVTAVMHHIEEHVERLITGLPASYATKTSRAQVEAKRS